ncbi:IGF-like family receptor 1 [Microtus ochrogaster]|uniref:IGF-like family receptor 1 n=1 Tax=Microtus ochrogaster TaxID=79684 RepID=A0A8J6GD88_MICOH|nr:IGF-like family receptor 1 [Microtus ochrogaster]
MGPRCIFWTATVAVLLLIRAASREVSWFCGRLEYWNPDNRCCRSCLQRFGPPACPDYEFTENCGLNDFGDTVAHPFRKCSPGYCNPNGTELCSPCSSGATTPAQLQGLTSQPLSRLLDELEVLEELIMLLDPEPGPGGSMAYGTTRHLAARYGLPATWSTFAYSLRPNRSPLRALIEMVVAREPSATLGQLGIHLAQLGRADALQVLSKLG